MQKFEMADIKEGLRVAGSHLELRIMAVAKKDKYALVRYKGCIPFAISFKDLLSRMNGEKRQIDWKFDI